MDMPVSVNDVMVFANANQKTHRLYGIVFNMPESEIAAAMHGANTLKQAIRAIIKHDEERSAEGYSVLADYLVGNRNKT